MKGRICAIAIALAAVSSAAYSQATPSKLSDTSADCFLNAIDWTAGPNVKFNTLQNDYILGGLDFTGGGIGYYKSGAMPLSLKVLLKATKNAGETLSEVTGPGGTTTYTRPVFNDFAFNVDATIGLPSVSDLSIGLSLATTQSDHGLTTTPPAGAATTTVDKDGSLTLGVPFGMKLGAGYNYAIVQFNTDWNKTDTLDQSRWNMYLYDKYRFASILPGGTWTAVTASFTSPRKSTLVATDAVTTCSLGILNRFDVTVADGITLALIPQVRLDETATFDSAAGSTSSIFNTLITLSVPMGLNATIPGSPISLLAGITPRVTINLTGSTVSTGLTTSKYFDNDIEYGLPLAAILCITATLPGDASIDLQITNASTYAIECVIPLKPAPAAAPKAATAPAKKAEKPATQPAPQAAAKPADKAAAKKN